MIVAETIIRPLTEDEKKEMIELKKGGNININKLFSIELGEQILKCTKDKIPFCTRCAQREFEDEINSKSSYARKFSGDPAAIKEKLKIKIEDREWSKYQGDKRFNEKDTNPVHEKKFIDGAWVPYVVGWNKDFVCKECGAGSTIFIPSEDTIKKEKFPGDGKVLKDKDEEIKKLKQELEKTKQKTQENGSPLREE